MKTFKQYLNEAKIDVQEKDGGFVCFDSIEGCIDIKSSPFIYQLSKNNTPNNIKREHRIAFKLYGGDTEYYKPASNEENELYRNSKDIEKASIGQNNYPYKQHLEEGVEITKDIKKIMDEFDKKLESVMKKYGYKRG